MDDIEVGGPFKKDASTMLLATEDGVSVIAGHIDDHNPSEDILINTRLIKQLIRCIIRNVPSVSA